MAVGVGEQLFADAVEQAIKRFVADAAQLTGRNEDEVRLLLTAPPPSTEH